MTFEEHLEQHRNDDGSYDVAAAEQSRAEEILENYGEEELGRLAAKAAATERRNWENRNGANLRKQLTQGALAPELELDAMVQIGDSTVVRYGEMDAQRIRLRMDLRTKVHMDENEAFNSEQRHWLETLALLDDDETISVAMARQP